VGSALASAAGRSSSSAGLSLPGSLTASGVASLIDGSRTAPARRSSRRGGPRRVVSVVIPALQRVGVGSGEEVPRSHSNPTEPRAGARRDEPIRPARPSGGLHLRGLAPGQRRSRPAPPVFIRYERSRASAGFPRPLLRDARPLPSFYSPRSPGNKRIPGHGRIRGDFGPSRDIPQSAPGRDRSGDRPTGSKTTRLRLAALATPPAVGARSASGRRRPVRGGRGSALRDPRGRSIPRPA